MRFCMYAFCLVAEKMKENFSLVGFIFDYLIDCGFVRINCVVNAHVCVCVKVCEKVVIGW